MQKYDYLRLFLEYSKVVGVVKCDLEKNLKKKKSQ
jgi:hypothetical protein